LLPSSTTGAQVDELLPRGRVTQRVVVGGVWPLVRTRTSVTADVGAAPGGIDPKLGPVTVARGVWTVPWLWLAAVLLVLVVVFRRRLVALVKQLPRSRRGGRHAGGAGLADDDDADRAEAPATTGRGELEPARATSAAT
jgi:hypothetical protein